MVALEDDDPAILVKMVQRLRAAEVRKYTAIDTPIFLGLRMPVEDAITQRCKAAVGKSWGRSIFVRRKISDALDPALQERRCRSLPSATSV